MDHADLITWHSRKTAKGEARPQAESVMDLLLQSYVQKDPVEGDWPAATADLINAIHGLNSEWQIQSPTAEELRHLAMRMAIIIGTGWDFCHSLRHNSEMSEFVTFFAGELGVIAFAWCRTLDGRTDNILATIHKSFPNRH